MDFSFKKYIFLAILFLGFSLNGISQNDIIKQDLVLSKSGIFVPKVPVDSMIAFGKTYLGLPYRSTTRAPWPLDCSGYVAMMYGQYGVIIPHSSGGIAQVTKTISLKDAVPGDLIFFRGRDSKKNRVGHVAMIIEVHDNYVLMMHSTCSKGIIVEQYPDGYYYTKRFVKVGRLL